MYCRSFIGYNVVALPRMYMPTGYSVIVSITVLPIGYSVIVALTGLPIGYSVTVALTMDSLYCGIDSVE